ncbi:MAG: hypothetical protein CL878_10965 [Dehalococcoidia bacterium]|nr:hypothetical protein [Dehalococcoidia bacterium]
MPGATWYFGLTREGGYYHIVAVSTSQAQVLREMRSFSGPTAVATRDELGGVGIGEREIAKWLPPAQDKGDRT